MTRRPTAGERVFRALLRLLPREFRGDFGDAMEADFAGRRADSTAFGLWRRELPGLVVTAAREHAGVLRRDVQYALRLLRRTPGFTASAVLMLALGTGANAAMFSVVDGVMLRSPFTAPEQLAIVQIMDADGRETSAVPVERFDALAAASGPFAAIGALDAGDHMLTGIGDPRRIDLECVTASMFDVLGTRPRLGRTFGAADDRPGAAPTIVLNHRFWRELGAPADIVGRHLTINQTPVMVVGVMPDGFDGAYARNDTAGWLPLAVTLTGNGLVGCRKEALVNVFARVRDGLSIPQAEAALSGVRLRSLHDQTLYYLRTPLMALSGAVCCVLLIACLNVGGLQLERTLARQRELSLRLSLGASHARLVRQALTESLVLAGGGAAAGLVAAAVSRGAITSLLPANTPYVDQIAMDRRVLLVVIAAAAVAGLVAGLLPVLQLRKQSPLSALKESGRHATAVHGWTRRAFVVAEIALSVVVLIGAGLMIRTFLILRPASPGFEPRQKLATLVRLIDATAAESASFFERLTGRVREMPGVRATTVSSYLPMSGTVATVALGVNESRVTAFGAVVAPNYLDVMRIPVMRGRGFTGADVNGSTPVALVNETAARRLEPDGNVLGMRVKAPRVRSRDRALVEWTIVGVIGDTRSLGSDTRARPEFYQTLAQNPIPTLYLVAEVEPRQQRSVEQEIRRAMRDLDADLAIEPVRPLVDMLNARVEHQRLGAWLLGVFAAMAVVLAAAGLMMTMSWWVRERTRELGVRTALGASRVELTRMVLRQGMTLATAGIAIGCSAAALLTGYLGGWIYGVAPLDAATFAGAAGLMLVVASMATYGPVRRAARIDPVVALRAE